MMFIEERHECEFRKLSQEVIDQFVADMERGHVRWISDRMCEWKSLIIECDGPEGRISTIKIKEII